MRDAVVEVLPAGWAAPQLQIWRLIVIIVEV